MQTTEAIHTEARKKVTPELRSDLGREATQEISSALRPLLADVFALYVKTKNFIGTCRGAIFVIITCYWTNRGNKFSP